MHGLPVFLCDTVFVSPPAVGLEVILSRFTNNGVKSVAVNIIPYWNKLPEDIVNATSVETFKSRLDAQWQSLFPEAPL